MTDPTPERKKIVVQQNATAPPFEVYHLAHDLRGPLNSILGFTELLLEEVEGPLTDIQKEDITAINQSAHNLLRLINNMVDVSKLDAERFELNMSEVELAPLINEVLNADFWVEQSGQVKVTVKSVADLPMLWGDSVRIGQMLEEALAWAKLKGARDIIISVSSDTDQVTAQVHLAGVIVTDQDTDDIFKLIIRRDAAGRSHLGPGGLEMPLVGLLAEKQKGRVWIQGASNGTSIYMAFPTAASQG